jgi:hypothetical protein
MLIDVTSDDNHSPPGGPSNHRVGLVSLRPRHGWELHPAVRSNDRLGRRERAAALVRDVVGTWPFIAVTSLLCAGTLVVVRPGGAIAILSVVLSGLAVVELSVVLMATRRTDEVAAEVALFDLESDRRAAAAVEDLRDEVERLRGDLARLTARLQTSARPMDETGEPLP